VSGLRVRPGLIKTPMTGAAEQRYDKLLAEGFTPINRWGTPTDIGRAVASIANGHLPKRRQPSAKITNNSRRSPYARYEIEASVLSS
jgi:NAD(P)-dependent dehydrogenase (short-subunit alcohol dehydrogenase family)